WSSDVCSSDLVFQNVLCVTRRSYPQHFQPRILGFHLLAQVLKHFDGVLDWIAVRELIGLAQNVAFFVQQNSFRGCGTSIDSYKAGDRRATLEIGRHEFLPPVRLLESLQFGLIFDQTTRTRLGLLFLPTVLDL